jgi:hypothetical protein
MSKEKELLKYSNPDIVFKKFYKLFPNGIIHISTRKDKKYMAYLDNKIIHFGQMFYQDFTRHRDLFRRNRFKQRNHRWAQQDKNTAGYLAYTLLW